MPPRTVLGTSRPTAAYLPILTKGGSAFPDLPSRSPSCRTLRVAYHAHLRGSTSRLLTDPVPERCQRCREMPVRVGKRNKGRLKRRRRPIDAALQHAVKKPCELS